MRPAPATRAFIALIGALLAGAGCEQASSGGDPPAKAPAQPAPAPPPPAPEPAPDPAAGQKVFEAQNCWLCHGENGAGSTGAPALVGLSANWDREKLAQYFKDPQGFSGKDPRLNANQDTYPVQMPPFVLSPPDEQALIDFLLSR